MLSLWGGSLISSFPPYKWEFPSNLNVNRYRVGLNIKLDLNNRIIFFEELGGGFPRRPERRNVAEETPRIPIDKPFFVSKITCFIKIKNICILFKTFYSEEIG